MIVRQHYLPSLNDLLVVCIKDKTKHRTCMSYFFLKFMKKCFKNYIYSAAFIKNFVTPS